MLADKSLRLAVMASGLLAILAFLWFVKSGLYPFIIAFFFAYLLNPAVSRLENRGISRRLSILVVYGVVFGTLTVVGIWGIPLLIRELEGFGQDLPLIIRQGEEWIQYIQSQYQNSSLPNSLRLEIDNALLVVQEDIQRIIATVVNSLIGLVSHAIGLMVTPILAYYLLIDWHKWEERILSLLPARWQQECILTGRDIDTVLSGIIRGQIMIALIVGLLVTIGLHLLKVPYALLIGIVAGMVDIIPYFGAIIGATPAITLALLTSPWLAAKVSILFIVIHQLEGSVIGPKILGENAGLHPLSVIFFLFAGGELAGVAGMLLSVPLAAIGKVLLRHMLRIMMSS